MSRGIGEFAPVQDAIPDWAALLVALLTQLGDIWFLTLVLLAAFWVSTDRREDVAAVAGAALAGMGLYRGLKFAFELPRPDEPLVRLEQLPWIVRPLYEAAATAGGYGFPSGHAVNSTIVYFGLACVLVVGSRRYRYAAAATLVTTISVTRVALGVHYLVDVVVGVSIGATVLGGIWFASSRRSVDRVTLAFGLAVVTGLWYVVTSQASTTSVLLTVLAVVGLGSRWLVRRSYAR